MASRSGLLFLAVVLSCLVLTLGKIAENGLPDREELDSKYLLTNQIVELNEQIEELASASKTQAVLVKKKDKKIRSLEKELNQLKTAKNGADAELEAKLAAATKKNSDLDLQVSQLKEELERVKSEHLAILKRAEIAEARADSFEQEASEKLKLVQIVNELKSQLKKAERALQISQSGMLKAQKEAAAKAREVAQSADAWFPPWLATQAAKVHAFLSSRWATHGRPLLKLVQRGVSVKVAQVEKFSKPYIRSFQKNVRPVVRSEWKKLKAKVVPEYRRAKRLTVRYYQAAKKYTLLQLSKVQESVDPFVQTVREKSQPFVEQAASFLHPHMEKAGPYVKRANDHFQSVVTQATTYHEQLQDSVKGIMSNHQVLARYATKDLIWYLASALLALPVVAPFWLFSSVFGSRKPVKRQRRSPASSTSTSSSTTASGNKKPRRPRSADIKQEK
ncbi:hypothetical protein KC19_4G123100 [Ceratodon purpureus]|uniref:Uncharacterized protein n=1 Tax=Ceratodon purpureus TaxID=3225 RepID=A0A8T0I8I2_CERPU|nr:hypothetical protein KC19_4G123100 [Ceratodon purpureus]KAG0579782.1 hypothetical protein KC19_4G123100 [Ceratodon purpureus]